MPRGTFQCSCPCGELLSTHVCTGGPPTVAGSFGSVFCKVSAPLLWVLVHTKFCLYSVSLSPLDGLQSNPAGPQGQIPWGFPVPLSNPQARNLDVGFRTFIIVWELLWYYCSPVCGSPIQLVWDLIWSSLCPSYHLAVATSLSLDSGYPFSVGSRVLLSVVVQQLVAILVLSTGGDEHTSFLSTILNQKPQLLILERVGKEGLEQ